NADHAKPGNYARLSLERLQKIVGSIDALKPGDGIHWETVIPVFVSAILAMCVGIALEYFKSYREAKKSDLRKRKDELTEINIATIALGYNLELLIHFTFQNILPHYEHSQAAYKALKLVPNSEAEIAAFIQSLGDYPHLMLTAPELNFLEHDFLAKLPFVIGKEPELLKQANWLTHLSRVLRRHLYDRNSQIELARTQGLKGFTFPAVGRAIQVQASLANTECATILSVIEQIPPMTQMLELVGRSYLNAGKLSTLIPPPALHDAITRLREIAEPLIQAMPDHQRPNS
ncbi:MAG: hypothetical protein ACT4O2_10945, partial [Beijerinckiaceae bacterium]